MKNSWKKGIACFLAVALVAVLCLGCGDDKDGEEKVTIVVGNIIDLSGPASPAVKDMQQGMEDIVKYYNDEDLIPGARIELVTYDDQFNPARAIPGYEWCRGRGAKVIWAVQSTTTDSLKPFAERDKVPIGGVSITEAIAKPPGWIFFFTSYQPGGIRLVMKWISEEQWDWETEGPAKVGAICWRESKGIEAQEVVEAYCQANQDKFDYVGGFLPPMGTMTFGGEVEKLKDCDYIYTFGMAAGNFIKEYREREYGATFFGDDGLVGYYDFLVELLGWEALDGTLTPMMFPFFGDPNPAWDLIEEVLDRYHPGQSPEDKIFSYSGAFYLMVSFFEVLRQAVEEVGAENFDGQAYYDKAVKFTATFEGLPEWGFTETRRHLIEHGAIHEWSAEAQGTVRLTDWLPFVME